MILAQQGDEAALTQLIRLTQSLVFGYLVRMTGNPLAAEDLYQDTWLKIVQGLPAYRPQGRFRGWLMTIAHHTAISHLQRPSHLAYRPPPRAEVSQDPVANLPDPAPPLDDDLAERERRDWVARALLDLPADLREVVILRLDHGFSFKDIARLQGVSINTVLGRMRYAIQHLRARDRAIPEPQAALRTIKPSLRRLPSEVT